MTLIRFSSRGARVTRRTLVRLAACAALLSALAACSTLRYTAHVARGQLSLLAHRQSVARIINDPGADDTLRTRLRQAQAARVFASDQLALPRNRSYTTYVDLHRTSVTWNVFAAPEFSVEPIEHCFPFAGCVAYLGFFDRARADDAAAAIRAKGNDVAVEGAAAYSTLGWFADPILSSMLRWDDDELDGVIFHELAHQRLYIQDDTAFNESFATFVQQEGLRQWRVSRGEEVTGSHADGFDRAVTELALELRERLRGIYSRSLPPDDMRAQKASGVAAFRLRFYALRDGRWAGDTRYERWVAGRVNNASLVPFGLYDRWTSAFSAIFERAGHRWAPFYDDVTALSHLPRMQRDCTLISLSIQTRSSDVPSTDCPDQDPGGGATLSH
ncbi:MAG: aminopeptidase [Dokdonella sp.]|uniref:aminopeptidase n=1 Tax=Dokdonella sp. TaxID=2291710 RepID=UPI00326527C1